MSCPPAKFWRPDEAQQKQSAPPVVHRTAVHDADTAQPDPQRGVVFAADGTNADHLKGLFRGASCFLCCGGPSLASSPLRLLDRRGVLIAAVNNVAATCVRPHLWFACDHTHQFHEAIWRDPAIMKFTKLKYVSERHKWAGAKLRQPPFVHRWNGKEFTPTDLTPSDCPNVWGYMHTDFRHHPWNPRTYFDAPLPPWGSNATENDPDGKSWHKTIMLVAPWLLRWLGISTVYLVGCDFGMSEGNPAYAFQESANVGRNNDLYHWINRRFTELAPHLPAGFSIVNCTLGGNLTAFPRLSLEEAVSRATAGMPKVIHTEGHYRG